LSHPPQVYAKIYPLGKSGANRERGRSVRQELIPLSHLDKHTKYVDLEPGRYYVETVLPSGEMLAEDVSVADGQTPELIFRPEYSPHEWLSWQHVVGNVQSKQPLRQPARSRRSATRTPAVKSRKLRGGGLRGGGKGGSKGMRPTRATRGDGGLAYESVLEEVTPLPEVDIGRPIYCLSHPHPALIDAKKRGSEVWELLSNLPGSSPEALVKALNEAHDPFAIPAHGVDQAHAVFRVSSSQASGDAVSLSNHAGQLPRYFVVVMRRQSVELASLPIPWKVVTTGREADIEIAIQQPVEEGGFCGSAIARDEQFGMLLGYLSSGSLPTVRQIAETATGMLYSKFENPFAAAAGAYALVGTALQATDRDWHDWVRNLMNSFPHIPDGAIQWGQLNLRMRRNSKDLEEAKSAFKLAYRRGLPFYSMGMRWLLEGLEGVSSGDAEAEKMLHNVRQLAWRTNYQQPFTIVRLGGESNV
jgi:hypothetical protein